MLHLTFRQLGIFEAVARHLNYTRAAHELHLSQPAVSMQIRQLEENVGLPLFEQIGKKIYLTEAGRELAHYGRVIEQQLSEAESVLDELKGLQRGKLRISVASTANYFVPQLLAIFSRRFPTITVSLDVTNRETLLRQLGENNFDLVVMGQPPVEADVEAQIFLNNPLVVVAPLDHPLANKKKVPLARLQEETFLVREAGSGTRIAAERFFNARGMRLKTGMEVGSNEAIKQSVQAGLGLGLLSRATIEQELTLKRLVVLDVAYLPIMRHWYVVHRKGKRLSAVAEAFKQFMLKESAGLMDGLPNGPTKNKKR